MPSCGRGDSPSGKLLPKVARPVNVWGHAKKNCRMNWQISYQGGVGFSLPSIDHRGTGPGCCLSMASGFFRTGRKMQHGCVWILVTHQALATTHRYHPSHFTTSRCTARKLPEHRVLYGETEHSTTTTTGIQIIIQSSESPRCRVSLQKETPLKSVNYRLLPVGWRGGTDVILDFR